MLGLLIDLVALMIILRLVDREAPDLPTSILAVGLMTAINFGIGALGSSLGILALGLMMVVDAAFLRWWRELTWPRALLFVVKIAWLLGVGYALS